MFLPQFLPHPYGGSNAVRPTTHQPASGSGEEFRADPEATKQSRKDQISALRAEQRLEVEEIQTQIRGYERALKAVTKGSGHAESQERKRE